MVGRQVGRVRGFQLLMIVLARCSLLGCVCLARKTAHFALVVLKPSGNLSRISCWLQSTRSFFVHFCFTLSGKFRVVTILITFRKFFVPSLFCTLSSNCKSLLHPKLSKTLKFGSSTLSIFHHASSSTLYC